jgi:uncharacterized membrane protein (Fun14 family)
MEIQHFDSIAAVTGGGFFAGVLIGYALKQVIKLVALIVGLFLAGLTYLQSQEILKINWDKLEFVSNNAISNLANASTQISSSLLGNDHGSTTTTMAMATNFGIPLTGSMATGLAIGFMKG